MKYHVGETPARYKPKHKPDDGRMSYQWPASHLTAEDMSKLHTIRMETNKPINQLIHEAVELFYELFRNEG
jgi:hypothetical protein